ncbi:MAG: HigA family addiction module antitoxin [Phycisphaeraceae bacterium]
MTRKPRKSRKPRKRKKLKPVHPGEILKHDFLDPLGITAYRLGKDIGVSPQHIGRIVNGLRGIGGDMALRLARYFGTSAQLWMGLQAHYEIDVAEDKAGAEIEKKIRPFQAA